MREPTPVPPQRRWGGTDGDAWKQASIIADAGHGTGEEEEDDEDPAPSPSTL